MDCTRRLEARILSEDKRLNVFVSLFLWISLEFSDSEFILLNADRSKSRLYYKPARSLQVGG